MYHSTPKYDGGYAYATHEQAFQDQVAFLSECFEVISAEDAYHFLRGSSSSTSNPKAVITFDDGYLNNLDVACPVLEQNSIPYTIFLTTNFITQKNSTFMSWSQVKELSKGTLATLGAHCKNHFNLRALEPNDKLIEITGSKQCIEEQTGKSVTTFSYPGGGYDEQCLDIVSKNFLLGFKDRYSGDDEDSRKVARISIDGKHNDFKAFLVELARTRYLWG